jgi:hypothetical protein
MYSDHGSFVGSIAMIRRYVEEQEQWLCIWDPSRTAFRLIEARRGENENFRSCLDDAIETDTPLSRKSDYLISGLSRAHHQAPIEWSGNDVPHWVVVQFFIVDLYGKKSEGRIQSAQNTRWWTHAEIARGFSSDGNRFCERQKVLIARADILPPWIKVT